MVTINNTVSVQNIKHEENASVTLNAVKVANVDGTAAPRDNNGVTRNIKTIVTERQNLLDRQAILEEQQKNREIVSKAKEKKRLKMLALQYEIKIREMKLKHAEVKRHEAENQDKSADNTDRSPTLQKESGMSKSVLLLEKIELGLNPIDLTNEAEGNSPKKRRSLLEVNPSRKPDLKLKADLLRSTSCEDVDKRFEVNIPEGTNLLRFLKLQVCF